MELFIGIVIICSLLVLYLVKGMKIERRSKEESDYRGPLA